MEFKVDSQIVLISPRGRQGFTLLELMVVLILMGAVSMIILPSLTGGLKGLELETTCRNLTTQMKRARFEAIGSQTVRRIILDTDELGAGFYVLTNEFEEEIRTVNLPDGIFPETPDRKPLPKKISFYANGRSSGGTILLINRQGKRLYVITDPITGLAKVRNQPEKEGTWR